MVQRIFGAITARISGLERAAFGLAIFSSLSLLLGFVRDRILTSSFGAGEALDVYYAAFKIPDLLFATVASLVSISALVPLFAKKETEGEKHLKDATNSIFSVFSFFIILFCAIAWALMPKIIPLAFAPLSPAALTEIIFLSRVLLLSPLLLGFSNFFGSIVQFEKRFVLYAISPLLYNIGIIAGLVFGVETFGIRAAVFGVTFGAFLHLFLQAAFILGSSSRPQLTLDIKWKDVWETAWLSVPRTFALSLTSFVSFFFAALAAKIGQGSIAVFMLAFNLQSIPLSIVGVSFSLAAFPAIAISAARKNSAEVIERMSEGLRQIILWSLPIVALLIVLRAHVVRVILGAGQFDWADTRLTAAVLALFAVSTVFQSMQLLLSRSHYALGNTKWPLVANIFGACLSVILAIMLLNASKFSEVLHFIATLLNVNDLPNMILALPLAYSLGSIFCASLLFIFLDKSLRIQIALEIRTVIWQSLSTALFAGGAAYGTLWITQVIFDLDTFLGVLGHGLVAGIAGLLMAGFYLNALGNREFSDMLKRVKKE